MIQLTRDQAIAMYDSKVWNSWTAEQIVGFQLFQEKLCLPFDRFKECMNEVLGRPVFTHEYGNSQVLIKEYLGLKIPPTLEEIINLIPEHKRVIIGI